MMELRITNPTNEGYVKEIQWNYEELKTEICRVRTLYANLVYNDDQIKEAKADRAKLNKLADAFTKKRTEVRAMLLAPDEKFGAEIKDLVGIINEAVSNIDGQVKGYENQKREEKLAAVKAIYQDIIGDMAQILTFDRVMKAEYTNATKSLKSIRDEITAVVEGVRNGLSIIENTGSEFIPDMKNELIRTLNIADAMQIRTRLETEKKNREQYNAYLEQKKAEAEAKRKELEQNNPVPSMPLPVEPDAPAPAVKTIRFECDFTSREQVIALQNFLASNNIAYRTI